MIKKTIKFMDLNGTEQTRDFWFHLTKADLLKMNLGKNGGMQNYLNRLVSTEDNEKMVEEFDKLLIASVGERSEDGSRFVKNKEITERFVSSEAYSELFTELATDPDKLMEFVKGVIPKELASNMPDELPKDINEVRANIIDATERTGVYVK